MQEIEGEFRVVGEDTKKPPREPFFGPPVAFIRFAIYVATLFLGGWIYRTIMHLMGQGH